jgi:hypothetical protein
MGLGLVASIASVLKLVNSTTLKQSRDNTWDSVPLVIWGFLEEHLAIIAACTPCLKALFERLLRRVGFSIPYKSHTRSFNISAPSHTRDTMVQDSMDGTGELENGVPGSEMSQENTNSSRPEYDSEGYVELVAKTST